MQAGANCFGGLFAPGQSFQPGVQLVRHRSAAFLMKPQPLVRRQAALARFGIVTIHLAQHFKLILYTAILEVIHYQRVAVLKNAW
jgi:hypothetical protein